MAMIEKRGNGYRITVSDGYDVNGKQVRHRMTWTPDPGMSERQIKKELQRQTVLFEEKSGYGVAGGHIKLASFIEQYFEEYVNKSLRERTRVTYRGYVGRVNDAIGHLYLDKITPRQIKSFILNLAEPGINQKTGKGMSKKSIKNYLGFLSSVFAYAISLDMISNNPCKNIAIPTTDAPQEKKKMYTLDEAQALLDSLEGRNPMYHAYVVLAVFCGYRSEELAGLEWKDIDFSRQTIAIRRASLYSKEMGIYTDVTKTQASNRVQKQQPEVFEILRQWRSEQMEIRLSLGDQWIDSGRVFTGPEGGPMYPYNAYAWLRRHCAGYGIRFLGIHALRHLNASLRISAGTDVRTVAAALGHSQASTTLNIYAYEFAEAEASSGEVVADLLTNKRKEAGDLPKAR